MAKRTYYRRRRYRRKIWSTRIKNFSGNQLATGGSNFVIYQNLCTNPAQTDDTVSNKYTVKNINLQLELSNNSTASGYVENLQAFVVFVPQGYIPTGVPAAYADLPYDHPEWIMAHRFYGSAFSDNSPYYSPLRLHTRLSRKLDTGDRIVVIILGRNTNSSQSQTIDYQGLVKYNTKAN